MTILIDNGHGVNTPGKCSPDGRLREWAVNRQLAQMITSGLCARGYDATRIVLEDTDVPLPQRVKRVNDICRRLGAQNVILVSVHINAAASDGAWHSANGCCPFVSKNASAASRQLASDFTHYYRQSRLTGNRAIPKEGYCTWSWTKGDIYILRNTLCPAVLTENCFQDNLADVDFLLSSEGKRLITDVHIAAIENFLKQ